MIHPAKIYASPTGKGDGNWYLKPQADSVEYVLREENSAYKQGITDAIGILKGLHTAYPELVSGEDVCFIGSQLMNHRDRT